MANKEPRKRKKAVEELVQPKAKPQAQKPTKEFTEAYRQIQKEYLRKLREAKELAGGNMAHPPEKEYD